MKKLTATLAAGLLILATAPIQAQLCGDADNNGAHELADAVLLMNYLRDPDTYATELTPGQSDCDGRAGITVSDFQAIFDNMWLANDYLDCTVDDGYTFAPVESDTLFVPYVSNVPDDITELNLPVIGSFAAETGAAYLPLLVDGTSGSHFDFVEATFEQITGILSTEYSDDTQDTLNLYANAIHPAGLEGKHELFSLRFDRSGPGVGSVNPVPVERSPIWKVSVAKNGELYTPTIVYYEVELDFPRLTGTPDEIALTAITGETTPLGVPVSFSATLEEVTFSLEASEPWIIVNVGPHTSPTSVGISADATTLDPGTYNGSVAVTLVSPEDAIVSTTGIAVTLTVVERPPFSPGDINCDGEVTIGDISLLVDHVFINPRPIPPCE